MTGTFELSFLPQVHIWGYGVIWFGCSSYIAVEKSRYGQRNNNEIHEIFLEIRESFLTSFVYRWNCTETITIVLYYCTFQRILLKVRSLFRICIKYLENSDFESE